MFDPLVSPFRKTHVDIVFALRAANVRQETLDLMAKIRPLPHRERLCGQVNFPIEDAGDLLLHENNGNPWVCDLARHWMKLAPVILPWNDASKSLQVPADYSQAVTLAVTCPQCRSMTDELMAMVRHQYSE